MVFVDLAANLLDAPVDLLAIAGAADDRGVILVDNDALGATELLDGHMLKLNAEILGDDLSARQHCNVLKHCLATIAETGGFDRAALERAANLIDDQRGEGLTLDILSHDQQRACRFRDLLQQWNQILEDADLAIRDEDQRILHDGLHLLRVCDEVRRDKAAVELHAFDDIERGLGGLGFLDRDHALATDLVHGVGHEFANDGIVMRGKGADLSLFLVRLDRARHGPQSFDGALGGTIEAALDVDCARAGHDVAYAVGKYSVRQNRCRAGSIADHVAGLFRGLSEHAGAEILLRVLEVELLGDGDAIVAHDRRTPLLLDQHRLGSRAQVSRAPHRRAG